MTTIPAFTRHSRIMLLAPHPDDESLACGVLLQRAVRAGASVRIVYLTDGDNNPWPQRAREWKWRLTNVDRARWGKLRREEALAALAVIGISQWDVVFLGLPDQGLTDLLRSGCQQLLSQLENVITNWSPTDILAPDITDTHPDHSAVGLMLRLVLEDLAPAEASPSSWSFLVHGQLGKFIPRAAPLRQTPEETATKMVAIGCHNTQLKLSFTRFMDYAMRAEYFVALDPESWQPPPGYLWDSRRDSGDLCLTVPPMRRKVWPGRSNLLLLGRGPSGEPRCAHIQIRRGAELQNIFDSKTGARLGRARFEHQGSLGFNVFIPERIFSLDNSLYLKVDRRWTFFDEAGWLQVATQTHPMLEPARDLDGELLLAAS